MTEGSTGNLPEFSVSELSFALKKAIEESFGFVRVRGEVGRVSRPGSGHIYLDLKDDKAVLNGVIWRGSVSRLNIQPEQGLEVICTGRLTTFPGQSRYQIVIESMEPAGVGALMALLEERRKKLTTEGLFAEEKKKPIPFLPEVIGVVTSPTGAVIRDILHRLADRFPRQVLIWPVLVQGEKAADQIAAAIKGFNALDGTNGIARPDVLIVARGGGSIEDLWAFNEEVVVRAAAESKIPLISAVGHETDTTLIDFASDLRAPTPTAAAERAVPVRADLNANVLRLEERLIRASSRMLEARRQQVQGLARGLPRLSDLMALPQQRLDTAMASLQNGIRNRVTTSSTFFAGVAGRLHPRIVTQSVTRYRERLDGRSASLSSGMGRRLERHQDQLESLAKLLQALSYKGTLQRGFAVVIGDMGEVIKDTTSVSPGMAAQIVFRDGAADAYFDGTISDKGPTSASKKSKKSVKKRVEKEEKADRQGRLL